MTATGRVEHRRQLAADYRHRRGVQPRAPRVFGIGPLLDAIADVADIHRLVGQPRTAEENRVLGLTRGRRRDYARFGLNAYTADNLAVHVGLHPAEIWSDWHTAADLEDGAP